MSACDRLADYRKAKKEYVWKRNATNGLVAGGLAAMALAYWIQPLPKYTLTTSFKTVSCDWANGQPYTELNIERSQVWVRPAVEPKHMDSFEQFARVAHFDFSGTCKAFRWRHVVGHVGSVPSARMWKILLYPVGLGALWLAGETNLEAETLRERKDRLKLKIYQ
jgi:hypothetical protein